MTTTTPVAARVNDTPLHRAGEMLDDATLRQRACTELLRQAAQLAGLLGADDVASDDGVPSEAASDAIERLLDRELEVPTPDDEACRRHHAAHASTYRRDERVQLRHVLFAVTPGVDLTALRTRAEHTLLEVRCDGTGGCFAERAREMSNCPSGEHGGSLGWLHARECVPEFAREVFGRTEVGVLPRLVHSRFGLHVVEVLARDGGQPLPYEEVKDAVRLTLRQQSWATALRQYLMLLAGRASIEGVRLERSDTPLTR